MSKKKQIVVQETSRSAQKGPTMPMSREQRIVAKRVEDTYDNALVAFANYETAQADFMKSDADAQNAKDIAKSAKEVVKKAKYDSREADAEYLEAIKASLAFGKSTYAAGQTLPSFPNENDIYDVEGFAGDKDGYFYLDPQGKAVTTDAMFRKIEKQDWNA